MLKSVLVCAIAMGCIIACSTENKEVSEQTKEKSKDILLIEKEVEKISLNPIESYDYCRAKEQILSLEKLASSAEAKAFVESEQKRLLDVLRRYLDDLTVKTAQVMINEKDISDVAFRQTAEKWRGWDIVTADKENSNVNNKDGIYTHTITYRYTIKKSGGLFSSDQYVSQKVKGIAKYILRCKGDEYPVTYSAKMID